MNRLIRIVRLAVVAMWLVACVSGGQQSLREGVLRAGIGQKAFRTEWGSPDAILPVLSPQMLATRWGTDVGLLRVPLELWVYERYGVELLFDDDRDLVAWKTAKTKDQLRAIPSERTR